MRVFFALILLFFITDSYAQKQLVFLKRGNVIARFTEGDRFNFKLKNRGLKEGYITELTDFSLITAALDTIPYSFIEKVNIQGQRTKNFAKRLGGVLLIGGLGYIAIDQANVLVGSNKSGFDDANKRALGVAGVGSLLLLVKSRYKTVSRGVTIRAIDYKSPYYRFK